MMHYYLFIKCYVSLHVSSHKCSSSGGYTVYMQHMVLSLSARVRGGLSVHTVHDARSEKCQAILIPERRFERLKYLWWINSVL